MSDEFLLSLRHSLHHLYDVARTLSWLHFLPLTILSVVIFLLPGCGDNHGNKTVPVRTVRYLSLAQRKPFPPWKEPERSMRTMKRFLAFAPAAG